MSEAGAAPAGGISAGTLLRQAREAAGLHVASLAVSLKVPVRKLEALEADQYDQLGDAVFVRALAASVCRTLKIDPQPVLERLPQTARPRLVPDTEGINAPFRAASDGPGPGWLDQISRPVALTVVALLLAAVVLIFLPVAQRGAPEGAPPAAEPVAPEPRAAGMAVPAEPATPTPAGAALDSPVAPPATTPATTPAPAAGPAAAMPAASAPAVPAAAAASAAPAASAPAAAASAPAAAGVVVFRTSDNSWIQVVDANGTTVLQRLMAAGESAGAGGALPLTVTVGSAQATQVQVRGQPFNLAPVTRDNVARFQVR